MLKDESENKNKLKNRQRTQPKFTWVSMSDPRLGRKTEIVSWKANWIKLQNSIIKQSNVQGWNWKKLILKK
jgi:hypothetical protein